MEDTMISILKLAFQLTKIIIVGFYLENDKLIIKIRPHAKRQARCPECGKACRVYDDLLATNKITLYDNLKRIGIDETSYKRGHKYITVIVNHDTSSLV